MNVASLKLCKELFELSGWKDANEFWIDQEPEPKTSTYQPPNTDIIPAYDLGYLLRKLPTNIEGHLFSLHPMSHGNGWTAEYESDNGITIGNYIVRYDMANPEDAVAQLCVVLIKQGVLTAEEVK